ncbi:MAG: glycosyltransferase family 1 protein [Desulfovibrio sp.]|nr:MAG: glycosyltransferase family 1 protein [Desulfovibrio sp.]
MDKLAWFGVEIFPSGLARQGWTVSSHNYVATETYTWPDIVAKAGFEPDMLVLMDKSRPPVFLGVESYPCLTLFLCIDSHIHSWHPFYGQAFDLVTVSLKDHLPLFQGKRLADEQLMWLPPYARDMDQPLDRDKEWDVVFVGRVDPKVSPERHEFLAELKDRLPGLHVTQGDYRDLFSRAKVVLNYAERGDLNYRVFEALGCGACLVTPRLGHGQEELFTDREDVFLYDMDDMDGLVGLLEEVLADEGLRRKVAASGLAKVDQAHRLSHRARDLTHWIRSQPASELVETRRAQAKAIHEHYLKLMYLHHAEALKGHGNAAAYFRAAQPEWEAPLGPQAPIV